MIFDGSSRKQMKNLAQKFLESDVLSLDFASLLSRFWYSGREIASGILAFGISAILEAAKSWFGRDVAEACFQPS